MPMTKREEVGAFLTEQAGNAIDHLIAMRIQSSPESAKLLADLRNEIALEVAYEITEEYRFLQLADIMEWKRTRVRR
jgi:hypothetical protein